MMKLSNLINHNKNISTWNYFVISKKTSTTLGNYRTYGIRLSTAPTPILHDISTCKKTVMHIVKLLNQYQLSPIHLKDVVEDMLP